MKSQELLSQIKNLLGMEDIQLEKLNLENGTVLEAESFESGKEVFILSEDERIPLPVGEYQLEDGRGLEVTDEGVIADLYEHKDDEEKEEKKDKEDDDKMKMRYVTREEFRKEMDDLKKHIDEMMDHKNKEKEEMAKVEEQVKQELSETPATEPIAHNPEVVEKFKVKFSQNRRETTLDKIMKKLSNN